MTKKLADSRTMTIEDADRIMQEIAAHEIKLVRIAAKYEGRMNKVKADCDEESAPFLELINSKAEKLKKFIENNPGKFVKPKSRKTEYGKYGVRKVSNLDIKDENAVITLSQKENLGLHTTTVKVDKAAVKAAIKAGKTIPGAVVVSGEEIFYTIDKKLLDKAKDNLS